MCYSGNDAVSLFWYHAGGLAGKTFEDALSLREGAFEPPALFQTGSEQYCTSGKCFARQGISSILKSHLGREVCGEAVDGRQAVQMVKDLKPQIVILESAMPMLNGLEIPSEPVNRVLGQTRTAVLEKKGSCYLLAHGG